MKKQEKGVKLTPSPIQHAPASCIPPSSSGSSTSHSKTASTSSGGHTSNKSTSVATTEGVSGGSGTHQKDVTSSGGSAQQSSKSHPPGTGHSSSTTTTTSTTMGMKHSKSDHSGLGKKEKHGKEGKDGGKEDKSPMGKKFISKSQDNLSSQKKGKPLSTVVESPRPRANATSLARAEAASEKNKENQALREREKNANTVFVKPKPVKPGSASSSSLRKASSTHSIDQTSQGSGSGTLKSTTSSSKSSTSLSIKRAQSTQNICKDKFTKKRTSAPADVMAYNAELLANFEKEKKLLEIRISELTKMAESRKGEIEKYKYEVRHLKDQVCSAGKEEVELLRHQNRQLQDRLSELGFPAEQVTDNEKLKLKLSHSEGKSHGSNSDICLPTSASCDSLSTDVINGDTAMVMPNYIIPSGGDHYFNKGTDSELRRSNSLSASEPGFSLPDLCGTPDHPSILSLDNNQWEKQSNKSTNSDGGLSEVSVACLTERILQMEETNYSTTEELQATLQELGDLQDTVNELTEENGQLADEKAVLLESLCTQTEKLENTRIQLEQLKYLLITGELPDKSERDSHLLGLLKSAQEEREELMRKQIEWSNALEGLESECKEEQEAGEALRDRCTVMEKMNAALKADREAVETQVMELKGLHEAEKIEVVRLRTQLENEKIKVAELESTRMALDRTDLEALLDSTRQEKAKAEDRLADLTESLSRNQCEVSRLKDSLTMKEQEIVVARGNARQQVSELQFRLEEDQKEKMEAMEEMDSLRGHIEQLEQDYHRHVEDKKSLSSQLQELKNELCTLRQKALVAEQELQELSSKHDVESEEWRQFQKDLQTAVVIANNFSQETQESMDQLSTDNGQLQEQVTALRAEVDKLKSDLKLARQQAAEESSSPSHKPTSIMTNAELKGKVGKVLNTMVVDCDHHHLAAMRDGRTHLDQRSQSISVKSLIRSIEEHVKSGCSSIHSSHSESRRSSTSSELSLTSFKELAAKSPTSPLPTPDGPRSPTKDFPLRSASLRIKPNDKSPQPRLSGSPGTPLLAGGAAGVTGAIDIPAKAFASARVDSTGELGSVGKVSHPISSILKDRSTPRRNSGVLELDMGKKDSPNKDPLASLAKLMKGSKRNALLKWCQLKTIPYSNVDITNFSSSWNDGLGFCALLHCYVPDKIPYAQLTSEDKRQNVHLAFTVGESIGIKCSLNINDMVCMERPDWQAVMSYVTSIYKHLEVDKQ